MFSKFKTDSEIVFLDPSLDIEQKDAKKIAVILSPALYWVRAFVLPVTSEKEAKKLLPSLFEDFLPEGEFGYYGYFEGERYIGFAYEEEKIRALLIQKGVDLGSIDSFHFAQSIFDSEMLPLKLDDAWMLQEIDGIVVKLPLMQQEELKPLDVSTLQLSSKAIKIERYAAPIEKKTLYLLCGAALLFALLYGAQWFKIDQEVVRLQQRSSEIFSKYSLLPTMTQNKSVLKKYEKIDTRQKKLRRVVAALLKTAQAEGGHLQSLRVQKQSVHAVFDALVSQNDLQNRLKSFKTQIKKLKGGGVSVEVAL